MTSTKQEVSVIDPKALDDLERLASAAELDDGILSGVNVIGGNPVHMRAFVSAVTADVVLGLIAEARALAAIRRFLTMAAKPAAELHPDDPEIPGAIAGLDRTDDALIGAYVKAWRDLVEEKASEAARLRAEREMDAARLRERVAELEAVVRGFVEHYRGTYHHDVDTGRLRVVDHACRRCVDEANASDDMVRGDFACAYHRAVGVVSSEAR